jgi:phosphopantetheinyl transferase (holo-ACP synthase)|tara:strand:- start:610 stop:1263 length:654 start_codon:yes stop_codon:yes gene_type:complete
MMSGFLDTELVSNLVGETKDMDNIHIAYSNILQFRNENEEWKISQFNNGRSALYAAAKSFGINMEQHSFIVVKNDGGKVVDKSGNIIASASISHTKEYSFAIIMNKKYSIGLDVEKSNRYVGNEVLRYITKDEHKGHIQDGLLTYWIKKEAISKATGFGLNVAKDILREEGSEWSFNEERYQAVHWEEEIQGNRFSIAFAKNKINDSILISDAIISV